VKRNEAHSELATPIWLFFHRYISHELCLICILLSPCPPSMMSFVLPTLRTEMLDAGAEDAGPSDPYAGELLHQCAF